MSEIFDITSFSLDGDNSYDVANCYDVYDAYDVDENKLVTYYDLDDKIVKMFNTFFDTDVFNITNTAPGSEFCQKFFPNLNLFSDIGYKCLIKDDLQYSQLTYPDIINEWVGDYLSNVVWKENVYPCINVGGNDVVQLAPLSSDIEYNQCITTKDIKNLNFYNIDKNSFLLNEIKCKCNVFAQFEKELWGAQFIRCDFNYGGNRVLSLQDLYYDDINYWLEDSILERLGVENTIFKIYGGYNLPCRFHFTNPVYEDMKVILTSSKDDIVYFDFENSEWVGSYECTFDLPDNKDTYVNIIYNNENHLICFKADDSAEIINYTSADLQYKWKFAWMNAGGRGRLKITESFQEFLNPAHMLVYQYDNDILYNMEIIIPSRREDEILFPFGGEDITLDIMPSDYEIGMKFIETKDITITVNLYEIEITAYINEPASFDIPVSIEVYLYAGLYEDEFASEELYGTWTVIIPSGKTEGSIIFNCKESFGLDSYWESGNVICYENKIIESDTYIYIHHHSNAS